MTVYDLLNKTLNQLN